MCEAPILLLLKGIDADSEPLRLRKIRPDIEVGVTVGAGHFHQLEVPDQVNAMIERFLAVSL
jgi:pimeloyl-ACP methyl ester carboxylesterase